MQVNWSWAILIIAGCFEAGFAFCLGKMKEVSGTAWWLWGAGFIICLVISMFLLAKATQTLPISTAYPVWTGIGAVLTVILGILVCFLWFIIRLAYATISVSGAGCSRVLLALLPAARKSQGDNHEHCCHYP